MRKPTMTLKEVELALNGQDRQLQAAHTLECQAKAIGQ
jgi:hypothetical protein